MNYKLVYIGYPESINHNTAKSTERTLNKHAKDGWYLRCLHGSYAILEKFGVIYYSKSCDISVPAEICYGNSPKMPTCGNEMEIE